MFYSSTCSSQNTFIVFKALQLLTALLPGLGITPQFIKYTNLHVLKLMSNINDTTTIFQLSSTRYSVMPMPKDGQHSFVAISNIVSIAIHLFSYIVSTLFRGLCHSSLLFISLLQENEAWIGACKIAKPDEKWYVQAVPILTFSLLQMIFY